MATCGHLAPWCPQQDPCFGERPEGDWAKVLLRDCSSQTGRCSWWRWNIASDWCWRGSWRYGHLVHGCWSVGSWHLVEVQVVGVAQVLFPGPHGKAGSTSLRRSRRVGATPCRCVPTAQNTRCSQRVLSSLVISLVQFATASSCQSARRGQLKAMPIEQSKTRLSAGALDPKRPQCTIYILYSERNMIRRGGWEHVHKHLHVYVWCTCDITHASAMPHNCRQLRTIAVRILGLCV